VISLILRVNDDYPLLELSEAEKIYHTNAMVKLIWSIYSRMVIAFVIEFWNM
jgi:hypothetical protein